jgi:5-hydroxytryptamine receptor 2
MTKIINLDVMHTYTHKYILINLTLNESLSSLSLMPILVLDLCDHTKVFKDGRCLLTDDSFVLVGSFLAFFIPLTIMVVSYLLTISALQTDATICLDRLLFRPK